jgi:branched-subunit amino acid ABC-type transport system permease component
VREYLPFLVGGIASGSIYGIAAMGLVLTYKTSGLFNFGHGAIAAAAAYVFYEAHTQHSLAWPIAAAITVFGFGPIAGLLMELLARRLSAASTANKIVATLGILITIQALAVIRYGASTRPMAVFLPAHVFNLGSVNVTEDQIITVVIGLLAAIGLALMLRRTQLGGAMRAVVDDPALLDLTGVSPTRVRRLSWVIGCCFASLSGILIAPVLGLDATLLTLLIVQAFGAAAIGAFSSLPLSYIGGLVVGIAAALSQKWVANSPALAGLPNAVPFLVLFLALLVIPKRRLVEVGQQSVARVRARKVSHPRVAPAGAALGLIALAVIPFVVGARLPIWSQGLGEMTLFLSLALLVRTSGQVSLCHIGFAATGAAAFAHLVSNHHWPWLLAVLVAGLLTVPLGAIIAVPSIRLSGLYLALATFGFGLLLSNVAYRSFLMFGGTGKSLDAPRPHALGLTGDRAYYYVLLVAVVAVAALIFAIERTRLGRLLRGLARSPVALMTHGADVNITRVIVFCVSAFIAGVSGALAAPIFGFVNQEGFNPLQSLTLLTVLVLGGRGTVSSAVVGSLLLYVVPGYINSTTVTNWLTVSFGLSAIAIAMLSVSAARPGSVASRRRRDDLRGPIADRWARAQPVSEPVLQSV